MEEFQLLGLAMISTSLVGAVGLIVRKRDHEARLLERLARPQVSVPRNETALAASIPLGEYVWNLGLIDPALVNTVHSEEAMQSTELAWSPLLDPETQQAWWNQMESSDPLSQIEDDAQLQWTETDAVSDLLGQVDAGDLVEGVLDILPIGVVITAGHTVLRKRQQGQSLQDALIQGTKEVIGRGTGALAGGKIGAILGAPLGPAGMLVGGVGGTVLGGIMGGRWAGQEDAPPLHRLERVRRAHLEKLGKLATDGGRNRLGLATPLQEALRLRQQRLEEVARQERRMARNPRFWFRVDRERVLLRSVLAQGERDIQNVRTRLQDFAQFLLEADFVALGIAVLHSPQASALLNGNTDLLEKIRAVDRELATKRADLAQISAL